MTKAKRKRLIYNLVTFGLVIGAFIILENMIAAKAISRSLKGQLVPICAWIIMAVSLNPQPRPRRLHEHRRLYRRRRQRLARGGL